MTTSSDFQTLGTWSDDLTDTATFQREEQFSCAHPDAVNADVARGLEAAVDRLEDDAEVWVGVLGANTDGQARPVFCAGADLKVIEAGELRTLYTERGHFGGFVYRERTKPIVVAVDGLATAGGLEIVLAADLVVATTRSQFALAEVKRNLIAAAGGLFRLPRAIGQAVAMEAILHHSNLCYTAAADAAGVRYHWHSYVTGTHAWVYGDRSLKDYLPRLMGFFRTGR